jgi:hypothetical protein
MKTVPLGLSCTQHGIRPLHSCFFLLSVTLAFVRVVSCVNIVNICYSLKFQLLVVCPLLLPDYN